MEEGIAEFSPNASSLSSKSSKSQEVFGHGRDRSSGRDAGKRAGRPGDVEVAIREGSC